VLSFIIRRLLYMVPMVLGTTFVLFLIFNVVPGDPALMFAGKHATPEVLENMRVQMGLDKSWFWQYVDLLKSLVTFDFGRSWATKMQISDMILEGAGPSVSLMLPPFLLSAVFSIIIGLVLAVYRGTMLDKVIVSLSVAFQSVSILVWVLAGQYYFAYVRGWFPITGYEDGWAERWEYLVLPGAIFIAIATAPMIRFYRTVFLDEIFQDYVRTARSKGLSGKTVMLRHVLKNAMIPIITDLVISLPFLILGSLFLESFFGVPGLGDLVVRAIANTDRPVIVAVTIMGSIAYIAFNLISDILYGLVDPRVQLK
jgi:peptide/nickel transport system permease protein